MGNKDWCYNLFKAVVTYLPIHRSDHIPLILDTNWVQDRRHRPKRFEEMWLQCEDAGFITRKVWNLQFQGSNGFQVGAKTKGFVEASL